ncbi:hypothetical protein UA08_07520 [Talaromyces atroroseus]|uniref:Ribosomal RNA-processing protein 8 n=1 Tax=Talaromyces atroroseus TaxID=1441469 RepID=A0A225AIY2_TALAT|nr:hypothetical protein UA08_07520 [Talaromyces atroroseus]OKL57108.1 hypothetical protein UA08_07520 [Talaromyces atroroseus]
MFAVPGWSISTSDLKSQKEDSSSKQKETAVTPDVPTEAKANGKAASQSAKKRKRGDGVTKSNLDEMFRRHIEGQVDSRGNKNNNKKNKGKDKKKDQGEDKKQNGNINGNQKEKRQVAGESAANAEESGRLSKKQKKNNRNRDKPQTNGDTPKADTVTGDAPAVEAVQLPPSIPPAAAAKLTPLQQKMRDKLVSARFRHLNETLYTTPSKQALEMFDANPELFAEYHAGFSQQVKESWPSNPVDGYIAAVRKRGAISAHADKRHGNKSQIAALPRRPNGLCTIADLGCGDAQFARALTPSVKKLQVKLLSYDLQAPDSVVTKADISNLPVTDGSVDITIFCLSLMGTNWVSFVEEAWRVLRSDGKGECWVSEVKSRFGKVSRKKAQIGLKRADMSNTQKKKNSKKNKKKKNSDSDDIDDDEDEDEEIYAEDAPQNASSNGDDTDISAFVEVFKSRGFILKQESVDKSNKMFVKMEFVKAGGAPTKGKYAGVTPARGDKQAPVQTKKKFIDYHDDESSKGLTAEQEAKVLKPCVYKIR